MTKLNTTQMAYMKNELCILVNNLDQKVGVASKYNCHHINSKLPLHRAFSLFLFHNDKLLLQQRSSFKATWPLKYTNSCCSHPLNINGVDETISDAIIRKTKDELGLKPKSIKFLGKMIYRAKENEFGEHELDHIYTGLLDSEEVPFNKEEVASIRWISKDESLLNTQCTPWFNLIRSQNDLFNLESWDHIIDNTLPGI